MDSVLQDLRHAIRRIRTNPGFAAAVIVTLALGVGANTTVFSLANWLVLRPLPGVGAPGELAAIEYVAITPRGVTRVSFVNYADLAMSTTAFSGLAGEFWTSVPAAFDGRPARRLMLGFVSGNYFTILGTPAQQGRTLTDEDAPLATSVTPVVISDALWTDLFGRDPAVVGANVRFGGKPATIVGVAAAGFAGTRFLRQTDAWVPYQSLAGLMGWPSEYLDGREYRGIAPELFGRLAPGASTERAKTELQTQLAQLISAYPSENRNLPGGAFVVAKDLGVPPSGRERVNTTLQILLGIAAVLGVIAAANVTNLLLFQGVRRRGDLAVRKALGASGARLARQSAIDIAVLAVPAAIASVLLSVWLVTAFRGLAISGLPAMDQIQLDGRVLAFAFAASLGVGTVVGLLAPLLDRAVSLSEVMKSAGLRVSARHRWARSGLAAVQLAASLTLLVGALLLVRTLRNLQTVDLGFDADRVASFTLSGGAGYSEEQYRALVTGLVERLDRSPGIERAGFNDLGPFGGLNLGHRIRRPDDAAPSISITTTWVSSGYFETLGIPLVRGRPFREGELYREPGDGENPVVVSETLGRRLYGDYDPVGRTFGMTAFSQGRLVERQFTVVGVARDARWQEIVGHDGAGPLAYLPFGSRQLGGSTYATLLLRSRLPIALLKQAVEKAVAELAPDVPVSEASFLIERVERTLAERRLFARTVTLLTVLAVALSALGLYGLVSFSVAERTKEFGIRIALGAQAKEILDLVVRQGAVLASIGVASGLVGAFGLSRLIANRLFGVTPLEPYIYLSATALLVLVALAASVIPARAATRVDPMITLRSE